MPKPSTVSTGTKINQWTAIRLVCSGPDGSNRRWLVKCSCGNERIVLIGSIVSGHSKSCGCLRKPTRLEARVNLIFKVLKAGAKRRGIPFLLSKSDIANLAEQQNWECIRTGIPLDLNFVAGKRMPFGPSIDRIDSNGSYEPGNIQLVCLLYNLCKNEYSDKDVLSFADALVTHSKKSKALKRAA